MPDTIQERDDYLDERQFAQEQRAAKRKKRRRALAVILPLLILAALVLISKQRLFVAEKALYNILSVTEDKVEIRAAARWGTVYVDITEKTPGAAKYPEYWPVAVTSLWGCRSDQNIVMEAADYISNMRKNGWYLVDFREWVCLLDTFGQKYELVVRVKLCDGRTFGTRRDPFE